MVSQGVLAVIRNKSYGYVELAVFENTASSTITVTTGAGEHLWIRYSKKSGSSIALSTVGVAIMSGSFGVILDDPITSDGVDALMIIPDAHADLVSIKAKYSS